MKIKPKKRKLPQARKTRKAPIRTEQVTEKLGLDTFERVTREALLEKERAIQETPHKLSMTFVLDDVKDKLNDFHITHGFDLAKMDKSIFIPESVVIDAYNQHDLIIAQKMQQVNCQDWLVGVDTHLFNFETEEVKTIPFQAKLEGLSYGEINMGAKVQVPREGGFKTRWKGLEAELNAEYKSHNLTGFKIVRTEIQVIGECYFKSSHAYKEFQFFKALAEKGELIAFLDSMNKQLQDEGFLNEHFQPKSPDFTGIPKLTFEREGVKYQLDQTALDTAA